MYSAGDKYSSGAGGDVDAERFRVAAEYRVEVADEALLANIVESRGFHRPANTREAIQFLFESDSWDVWQYPPGRVRLVDVQVDISSAD